MTGAAEDPKFAFEVVKLLLQVAWADHEVAPEEAQAVRDYATAAGVGAAELALLEACLAGTERLPPPNLALLRERRVEVLRAVRLVLKSDSRIHAEEEALLDEIMQVLK
jgi:uncharacterized tellurite resistance protein B-like protein